MALSWLKEIYEAVIFATGAKKDHLNEGPNFCISHIHYEQHFKH